MDLQEQLQRAFVELGLARPGLGVEPKTTDKAISLARGAIYAAQQALAAPKPSQGAQPVVDQEPASMSDNGSCGSQVSGKPVAQEAITWSPAGYNKELAVDATGKVRGEVCEHSIDPRWDARANDTRLGEYLNRDQAKAAVLAALVAPVPQPFSKEELEVIASAVAALNFTKHRQLFDKVTRLSSSQQREPQEAAEPATEGARAVYVADLLDTFEQLRQILGTPEQDADALIATVRRLAAFDSPQGASKVDRAFVMNHPEYGGPKEAGKVELSADEHKVLRQAVWDSCEVVAAGKVEPVADEAVAWQERQQTKDGWTDWYDAKAKTAMGKGPGFSEIIGGIKYQWRLLYLRPTQQALSDEDLDLLWLEHRPPGVSNEEQYRCARKFARAILAAAGGSEK